MSACKTKQQVVEKNAEQLEESERETLIIEACEDRKNNITWLPANLSSLKIEPLENKFDLYEVKSLSIQRVLELNFKKQSTFTIQIPVRQMGVVQCVLFEAQSTIDMETYESNGGIIVYNLIGQGTNPVHGQLSFGAKRGVQASLDAKADGIYLYRTVVTQGQRYLLSVLKENYAEVLEHLTVSDVRFL
jgi:hypothetical protein